MSWGNDYLGYMPSKEWQLRGHRRTERSYSMSKVRRGGHEERPLAQGKEQWLCFTGAAVKRYSMSKVRETQVRSVGVARRHQKADTLKP